MDNKQAIKKLRSQRDEICNGCLHAVGWCESHCGFSEAINMAIEALKQPEIVRCKDCVKHNQSYGNNGAIDSCPLVLYRGKAQGHEFDYQYCAFAERRTDGETT